MLGPLLLVLGAVVLGFVVFHGAHDKAHGDAGIACILLGLVLLVLSILPRVPLVAVAAPAPARAPPPRAPRRLRAAAPVRAFSPLRL